MANQNKQQPVVLHVIYSLAFSGALRIAEGSLATPRAKSMLFAIRDHGSAIPVSENILISKSKRKWSMRPVFELVRHIRKYDVAYIHCHAALKPLLICVLAKILSGKNPKLVIHEHGIILGSERANGLELRMYLLLLKLTRALTYKYVAVSNVIKSSLLNVGVNPDKIVVIYNFINQADFAINEAEAQEVALTRDRWGVKKGQKVVGFAARLEPLKGIREFLEAVLLVSQTDMNVKFVIVGEGSLSTYVKEFIASHDLSARVLYVGAYTPATIKIFYHALDCFVVPSYWESFSLASVEAQACGAALIASDTTGIREITQDHVNAILVNAHVPSAIAKAIEEVVSDDKLAETLSTNGKLNSARFSMQTYIQHLEQLYV